MLKVAGVPKGVKAIFEEFRDEFTKPSYESFAQLMGAMVAAEGRPRTVSKLQKGISDGKSRTAYEYFFNEAKWDEDAIAQKRGREHSLQVRGQTRTKEALRKTSFMKT